MKKIISYALVAGVISLGAVTQASAGYSASHLVSDANSLRAEHNELNSKASKLEARIRYIQSCGGNPVYLKAKAQKMRLKAKLLGQQANAVAKQAFDHGHIRHDHGHGYHSH